MIKGVNKRIIEVSFPESAYFEKAVVFLRTDDMPEGDPRLAAEAMQSITSLEREFSSAAPRKRRISPRAKAALRFAARAAAIVCAAYLIFEIIANM